MFLFSFLRSLRSLRPSPFQLDKNTNFPNAHQPNTNEA
jgi:hypothetical protein